MAATDLLRALDALNAAVARSGIDSVLAPLTPYSSAPRPTTDALLRCFAALSSSEARFGQAEEQVIGALDLQPAFDSAWWAELINALSHPRVPEALAQEVAALHARLRLLQQNLPKLSPLLQPAHLGEDDAGRRLAVTMPDLDGAPAGLDRVVAAVDAIDQFASAMGGLHGSPALFRLIAAEAGDGTTLLFDGSAQSMQAVKRLLVTVGEQLVAHQDMAPNNRLTVIAPSLPIMDEIRGHADAARLRAMIEHGVRRLLEAECSLPPPAGPAPARAAPGRAAPQPIDLRDVIAEERRQLGQPAQLRKWGSTARFAQME